MGVKTLLAGVLAPGVHRTDLQLEVSPVVGGDVDIDVDGLAHGVPPAHNALAVPAARLVRSGLLVCPVVPADPAAPPVVLPLDTEAPAVELVVVVVDRVGVAEPGAADTSEGLPSERAERG